jgi:hypothetical protein
VRGVICRLSALTVLIGTVVVALGTSAWGDDSVSVSTASHEWTILTGYGTSYPGLGDTRTRVQTVNLIGRFGWFLSDEVGKGVWYQGRHELLVELPLQMVVEPKTGVMTGGYLLGSWKFTSLGQWLPYIFGGGGIVYTNLDLPTMGSSLNFSYQWGPVVQYLVWPDVAFTVDCRYHHVSNAGTAKSNEPLNYVPVPGGSVMVQIIMGCSLKTLNIMCSKQILSKVAGSVEDRTAPGHGVELK